MKWTQHNHAPRVFHANVNTALHLIEWNGVGSNIWFVSKYDPARPGAPYPTKHVLGPFESFEGACAAASVMISAGVTG